MSDSPVPGGGPLFGDVQWNLVGDSLYYADQTEKPVAYVSVIRDQTVLGYLWANDEDQAAGFVPRPSAGDDAFNAGVAWSQRLFRGEVCGSFWEELERYAVQVSPSEARLHFLSASAASPLPAAARREAGPPARAGRAASLYAGVLGLCRPAPAQFCR